MQGMSRIWLEDLVNIDWMHVAFRQHWLDLVYV